MERNNKRINSAKRRKLIAAYRLPGAPGLASGLSAPVKPEADDELDAAVVNNSVMSFVQGMTSLNKEYTRKSYLLASSYVSDVLRVARGTEAWYNEFIKVMSSLGWMPVRSSFERVYTSRKGLSVQLAALNLMAATVASTFLSGPLISVLPKRVEEAVETLKQLPASFELFKRNTTTRDGGDFGLASCSEIAGEVSMVLVTYSSHGVSKQLGIPFLEWDSASVEAFSGRTCLVLNSSVVNEDTIQLLRDSAGDKVRLAIANYRI